MNRIGHLAVGLSLAFFGTAYAADVTLNPGDSIQAAVDASSPGDVITLNPGTYYQSGINLSGKEISIVGTLDVNGFPDSTIDAERQSNIFVISNSSVPILIKDLVITKGGNVGNGGAMKVFGSANVAIDGCWIIDNEATYSGCGIDMSQGGGNHVITRCRFVDNQPTDYDGFNGVNGGALLLGARTDVSDCEFTNNANKLGGAIYTMQGSSLSTITNCTFRDNHSGSGGSALFSSLWNGTMTDCDIRGGTGANAALRIVTYSQFTPTITRTTIASNSGGLFVQGNGDVTFIDCAIQVNGKGITSEDDDQEVILVDSVLCGNTTQIAGPHQPTLINTCVEDDCFLCIDCSACIGPIGACCVGGTCIPASPSSCADAGGTYGGTDTLCDDAGCPSAATTGACCLNDGCITATESACNAAGGTYAGDEVACSSAGCSTPPVTGACCVSSGCESLSSVDCTAMGGNWLGANAACDACPASCSGDTNSDGVIDIEDLLTMLSNYGSVCP